MENMNIPCNFTRFPRAGSTRGATKLLKPKNNDMTGYIKQEMKDLNGSGKNRVCYRLKRRGKIPTHEIARLLARGGSGVSQGDVMHVIISLGELLPTLLADGNSVTLDGIGTFSAGIGLARGKGANATRNQPAEAFDDDGPQRNAQSLEVKRICFTPSKELILETDRQCNLTKVGVSRLRVSPLTENERLQLLIDLLHRQPHVRVKEYSVLTGLSHSSAVRELQHWRNDPSTGITTEGRGNGTVYVLRKTKEETPIST